jgi:uncharacterized membrane protein HdeD (DUF308 family)
VLLAESAAPLLTPWQNFYVISGSSAGALTGLQFVVMALLAESRTGGMPEIRAFGSPTVVHFCAALLISGIMSAPWPTLPGVEIALAACGAAGVIYAVTVIKHTKQQSGYKPDREDWFWYAALPLFAYAVLLTAAILPESYRTTALFLIAAITLVLIFDGIHNAWDAVTYHVAARAQRRREAPVDAEVRK